MSVLDQTESWQGILIGRGNQVGRDRGITRRIIFKVGIAKMGFEMNRG